MSDCVVLFSGGTDSLCTAGLAAEKHNKVHLITYYELATKSSPWPLANLKRLQDKFGEAKFSLSVFSTDKLVRKLNYSNYFKNLFKFHFYNLATPGVSSLSWHLRTILYCKENNITSVYDGMTKELMHLPGHMPEIRHHFQKMYSDFGISFSSLVIDWDVPEDQRYIDKLIVDRHGFTLIENKNKRTTGEWLYQNKILPHPNVKGSSFDRLMQHDCYPFVMYNILVFWLLEPLIGYHKFVLNLQNFMISKIDFGKKIINECLNKNSKYQYVLTKNENT